MELVGHYTDVSWRGRGVAAGSATVSQGFTMVELLAVMALISALLGMLGYAVLNSGSVSLEGAERLAGAQFLQARQQAVLGNRPVRVLIHAESGDPERYLREIVLARQRADGRWEPIREPKRLPEGFFYLPERSLGGGTRAPERMQAGLGDGMPQWHYFFEYNSRGECLQPGAQFVIEPGSLQPQDSGYTVVPARSAPEERRLGWGGFMLLRLGGVLYFPDPESISG